MIYIVTALSVCLIIVALTMKKEDAPLTEEILTEATPDTISVEEAYELVCRNEIFGNEKYEIKLKENIFINNEEYYLFIAYNINEDENSQEIAGTATVSVLSGKTSFFVPQEEPVETPA